LPIQALKPRPRRAAPRVGIGKNKLVDKAKN
jgi:hypothetical protein